MAKTKTKRKSTSKLLCMNWPPSRGPMPEWMKPPPRIYPPYLMVGPVTDTLPGHYEEAFSPVRVPKPRRRVKRRKTRDGLVITRTWRRDYWDTFNAKPYLNIRTWVQVADVADVSVRVADRLIQGMDVEERKLIDMVPARSYGGYLDYPLSKKAFVIVPPYSIKSRRGEEREFSTVGWILWCLAHAYARIYDEHERYGIWGHAITDLGFEQLILKDDKFYICVGS